MHTGFYMNRMFFFGCLVLSLCASPMVLAQSRAVKVMGHPLEMGAEEQLIVQFESLGNENGLSFSLAWNPDRIHVTEASEGSAIGSLSGSLVLNQTRRGDGRLGVSIVLPPGDVFPPGNHPVLALKLTVPENINVASVTLGFGDDPVAREVGDAEAKVLPANFIEASGLAVNRQLAINPVADRSTLEDKAFDPINVSVTGRLSGPGLNLTAVSLDQSLIKNSDIVITGSGLERTIRMKPVADAFGSTQIRLTLTDGVGEVVRVFNVAVQSVDDPPTLGLIPQLPPYNESSEVQTLELFGISAGPANEDQGINVSASSTNPDLVEVVGVEYSSPDTQGKVLFKTGRNRGGSAQIVVRVDDGNQSVVGVANVVVQVVNDPPVLDPFEAKVTIREGEPFVIGFNASDQDSPTFRFVIEGAIPNGLALNPSTGQLSWTPNESQGPGEYSFIIKVIDNGQPPAETSAPFTIVVEEVNRAPEFPTIGRLQATEDNPFEFKLTAIDPDIPANEIVYSLLEGPTGLRVEGDGRILWTPSEDQSPSTVRVRVSATDKGQPPLSTEFQFQIEVLEENDPPEIVAPASLAVPEDEFLSLESIRIRDSDAQAIGLPAAGAPASGSYRIEFTAKNGVFFSARGPGLNGSQTLQIQGGLDEVNARIASSFYLPNSQFNGPDEIAIVLVETGLTGEARALIPVTVHPVNDPPFIPELVRIETQDGKAVSPVSFKITDVDSNIELVGVQATSSNTQLIPPQNLSVAKTGENIVLTIKPVVGLAGEARIEVIATDDAGASSNRSFLVQVAGRAPIVTLNPISQTVPAGSRLTLKAEAIGTLPLNFQWVYSPDSNAAAGSIIAGATQAVLDLPNTTPSQTGYYAVRIGNEFGQVLTRPVLVNVVGRILITTQPQSQTVAAGSSATFRVGLGADVGTVQFQWYKGNLPIKNATSADLTLNNVKPGDSDEYWVRILNAGGSLDSARALLRVGVPVRITRQPTASLEENGLLRVVEGEKFILSVAFEGSKPATVQWQFERNGVFENLAGADSNRLELVAQRNSSGRYRAVIINTVNGVEFSRATSEAATVDVLAPVQILSVSRTPQNGRVVLGAAFQLEALVQGDARDLRYQWQRNGKNIPSANAVVYRVASAGFIDSGDYTVVVNNIANRPVTSQAVSMFVVRPVESPINLVQLPPQNELRAGTSVNFEARFKGTGPFNAVWRKDGAVLNLDNPRFTVRLNQNAQFAQLTISNLQSSDSGVYDVVVDNETLRPVSSSTRTISVNDPTSAVLGFTERTLGLGQNLDVTVSITGSDDPYQVEWFLNGRSLGVQGETLSLNNFQREQGGSYTAIVKGRTQKPVETLPAVVIPDLPVQTFADAFENATGLSGDIGVVRSNNSGATLQPDEINPGGGSVWATLQPTVNGLLRLDTRGSSFDTILAIYRGDDLAGLTRLESDRNSGGFLTSQLEVSVSGNETYHIAVYGNGNAQGPFIFNWALEPAPVPKPRITANPENVTVQEGGSAFYTVQIAPPPQGFQPTYQWSKDGVDLAGERSSTLSLADLQISDAGKIRVRVAFVQNGVDPTLAPFPVDVPFAQSARANLIVTEQPDEEVVIFESFFDLFGDGGFGLFGGGSIFEDRSKAPIQLQGATLATAIELSGFATGGFASTQSFRTTGTFKEPGEPNHCGEVGGASQWSFIVPQVSGTVRLSTEGSDFDTVLAVYTLRPPGLGFADLVEVACDNDSGLDGEDSVVVFPVTAGQTYYTVIDGVGGASGFVTLSSALAGNPVVVNLVGNPVSGQSVQSASQTVSLQNLQLLSAGPSQTVEAVVPEGGNMEISVTASNAFSKTTYSYQWFFGVSTDDFREMDGETNQVLSLQNVTSANEGLYKVRVSNFAGASNDEESPILSLEIQAAPLIFEISDSRQVLAGSNQELSVGVSGSEPISFQWFFNNFQNPIAGANIRTLSLQSIDESQVGTYLVRAVNAFGVAEGSVALALDTLVQITGQPQSRSVNVGSPVSLSVEATGANLSYQWSFENQAIAGAVQSTYTINSVQLSNAGDYTVTVSSGTQSVESEEAAVQVTLPLTLIQVPQSKVVNAGSSVTFTVLAQGTPDPTYQWSFNGVPLANQTASSIILNDVQSTNAGTYAVTVTSGQQSLVVSAGLTVTQAETLRIEEPRFIFDPNGDLTQVQFNVVGLAGQRYLIERSQEPGSAAVWEAINSVTLVSESASVSIDIQGEAFGFFRVRQQ